MGSVGCARHASATVVGSSKGASKRTWLASHSTVVVTASCHEQFFALGHGAAAAGRQDCFQGVDVSLHQATLQLESLSAEYSAATNWQRAFVT